MILFTDGVSNNPLNPRGRLGEWTIADMDFKFQGWFKKSHDRDGGRKEREKKSKHQ